MADLETLALRAITQHQMLKNGDTVIVALSGGADSVALFHFLFSNRDALGIRVCAAHVDHGLRAASAADASFVRALCAQWGAALYETRLAPPPAGASEEWARCERYAFLEKTAAALHAKVATAHTQNDNAETVLLNLARGACVRGAAGVPPVRGPFIRPLLDVSRAEVEAYLAAQNLPHVEDESNAGDRYARNRVRHAVLPALESAHPGAARALTRFAASMGELADYLDAEARELLRAAQLSPGAWSASALCAAPPPVCRAALALLIARYARQEKTALTAALYAALSAGGAVQISAGTVLCVRQGQLRAQPPAISAQDWSLPFAPGVYTLPDGAVLTVECLSYEKIINSGKDEKKTLNFYADYDRIQENPCFRTRRPGDRFAPAGRGVTKTLTKLFSEARVPPPRRAALAVLALGGQVIWAEGFGFAEGFCATPKTKRAAAIRVRREMEESE